MVERRRGALLNVASVAGFGPLPGQAAYGAAKAFVVSYTHSLRGELRGTGVSATALCPGPVDTGFGEAAGFSKEEAESTLPQVMWIAADKVAQAGLDGLAAGKAVVVPWSGQPGCRRLFPGRAPRTAAVAADTATPRFQTGLTPDGRMLGDQGIQPPIARHTFERAFAAVGEPVS